MNSLRPAGNVPSDHDLKKVARRILATQLPSGEIPWADHDKTDPWDHVEAAMGLTVAGFPAEAVKAYAWLQEKQLPDGSWYAAYRNGEPEDRTRDTNMSAYIAVGLFHYYLVTGDVTFLKRMWKTVYQAMAFILSMRAPDGSIFWAKSPEGEIDATALLTGSSSVFMSLKCALSIAAVLGRSMPAWQNCLANLGHTLRNSPGSFDNSKARFSMDWFYPVLAGAVTGPAALDRLDRKWETFIVERHGVLCVSDEPWVTVAETSELCLALNAAGRVRQAQRVFDWIAGRRYDDGSFWCGYTWPDMVIWPESKYAWTNGVVLMAADALYGLTPAAGLFNHASWDASGIWIPQESGHRQAAASRR
jgi:hypothetical protein